MAELETLGRPGGELRMLMASPKDTRMMVVYGYARLVGYTPSLNFVPDILKRSMSRTTGSSRCICATDTNGRTGSPSPPKISATGSRTSRRINDLSPSGLPISMLPQGEPPHFEVLRRNDGSL